MPPIDMLPYRGRFGAPRPAPLHELALPPGPMPARHGLRPLKAWRYVAIFAPELMLCLASVRIGPAREQFWAVWDRAAGSLRERTTLGRSVIQLSHGRVLLRDADVELAIGLREVPGVESVCAAGSAYAWTRKQAGVEASGRLRLGGRQRELRALAVIDDTAAYYERHTRWQWAAGVGRAEDGRAVAWNLVSGVNDPPRHSERTVWIEGEPQEVPRCRFAPDLSAVDGLRFHAEATRERRENLLLVRSRYRQPFGTVSGELLPGLRLGEGLGVMEAHDVRW